MKDGDANTSFFFFHATLSNRRRYNQLLAIQVEELRVEEVDTIKTEVTRFFSDIYREESGRRPYLEGVAFSVLPVEVMQSLSINFSLEELEKTLDSFDGDKSPGLDGFNFNFIKRFWAIMRNEIWDMTNEFYDHARLPKGLLSYFVALIPKINSPQNLGNFRPISLLGCLYKLVSKLLASRLRAMMNPIISSNQSAFLPKRNIFDGVVIINEVVDCARKTGKQCFIFKVDFEKAYDSVNWNFLVYMMRRLGFNDKWRAWIKGCIFAGSCSVLVNGSPADEFQIKRGLKQGDPLALFLFLMVAERLLGLMRKAVSIGKYKGLQVGSGGIEVSILQYADDTIFVGEVSWENLWIIKSVLRCFEVASGLKC